MMIEMDNKTRFQQSFIRMIEKHIRIQKTVDFLQINKDLGMIPRTFKVTVFQRLNQR